LLTINRQTAVKFPDWLAVYGDQAYRGPCPTERVEQVTFFSAVRATEYGVLAFHPANEGKRTYQQAAWQKADGLTKGVADIIIPTNRPFCCEMKRQDHTKSKWQDGQIEFLQAAQENGAFVCVALGFEAAWQAFNDWRCTKQC